MSVAAAAFSVSEPLIRRIDHGRIQQRRHRCRSKESPVAMVKSNRTPCWKFIEYQERPQALTAPNRSRPPIPTSPRICFIIVWVPFWSRMLHSGSESTEQHGIHQAWPLVKKARRQHHRAHPVPSFTAVRAAKHHRRWIDKAKHHSGLAHRIKRDWCGPSWPLSCCLRKLARNRQRRTGPGQFPPSLAGSARRPGGYSAKAARRRDCR